MTACSIVPVSCGIVGLAVIALCLICGLALLWAVRSYDKEDPQQ